MLWAYFAFSQFLIIWSGNLPEEIGWYLIRTRGMWGAIILAVVILHFALPFLFLLSRRLKRDPHKLVIVAALILVMRLNRSVLDLAPAFTGEHFHMSWLGNTALYRRADSYWWSVALDVCLGVKQAISFPINDPQYESVLEQTHAGH